MNLFIITGPKPKLINLDHFLYVEKAGYADDETTVMYFTGGKSIDLKASVDDVMKAIGTQGSDNMYCLKEWE